jgi:hypothetical protein
MGRQSRQPVRHHALGLAGLKLRIGRLGQHQYGHGQSGRGNARLLPRPVQPQCNRSDSAAEVDDRFRWWRDRRGYLLRPQWNPRAHDRRLRKDPRRAARPDRRVLRSARPFHNGAARVGTEYALCQPRGCERQSERAQEHPSRSHSRIHDLSAGLQDRRAHRDRGGKRDQNRPRRALGRDACRILRPVVAAGSSSR